MGARAAEAKEGVEHNTFACTYMRTWPPPPASPALHVHFRVTDGGRTEGEADGRSLFSLFSAFLPPFLPFPFSRKIKLRISSPESNRAYFCALLLYYNYYYCARRDLDEKIKKASIHYRESETRHSTTLLQFYGDKMESER